MNTSKFQGYSFYRLWVIKGKPTGGVKLPPPPPRLWLKEITIRPWKQQKTFGQILLKHEVNIMKFVLNNVES